MKTKFYIVFDRKGAVRMTKKFAPSMYRSEVAVGFTANIPDSVFKEPIISATVNIPEESVQLPEIDIDVDASDERVNDDLKGVE